MAIEYQRIPLYSSLERTILDEAALLARERYMGSITTALSIMYTKLRNVGDSTAAGACYELIERIRDLEGRGEE